MRRLPGRPCRVPAAAAKAVFACGEAEAASVRCCLHGRCCPHGHCRRRRRRRRARPSRCLRLLLLLPWRQMGTHWHPPLPLQKDLLSHRFARPLPLPLLGASLHQETPLHCRLLCYWLQLLPQPALQLLQQGLARLRLWVCCLLSACL